MFYVSIRQKDGSRFKVSSLKAIRAAIDRYLRQSPHNKPWSIVGDPEFNKANETLNAVCKDMVKRGQVSPVVHKTPITSEQLQKLYESQQLGEATTTNPTQLLRTAWFYVTLYFGKRGRESQRKLEKQMLCLRQSVQCCPRKTVKVGSMTTQMSLMVKCLRCKVPLAALFKL